jgi:hypothetical protein
MKKPRLIHGGRERLEPDGVTHRRDCECARCEAGFTPSEHDREVAQKRAASKQGRLAATRAWQRKKERERLGQLDLASYFRRANAAADAEVQRLRALRAKTLADRRLDELLRLRQKGISLPAALAEVERRFSSSGVRGVDNDNGDHGDDGAETADVSPRAG